MSNSANPMTVFNNNPWGNVFGKKINIDSQKMPRVFRHIEVEEEGSGGSDT